MQLDRSELRRRLLEPVGEVPAGLCRCGCGQATRISRKTLKGRGIKRGEPLRYIHGHHAAYTGAKAVEEDRGHATPCWVWQLHRDRDGYGTVKLKRVPLRAHRWVYELACGPIPDGLVLDHLCRVTSCVNPDHLEPVTVAVNRRRGDGVLIDWPTVRAIRSAATAGTETHRQIAQRFGLDPMHVGFIVRNEIWRQ